MMVLEPTEQWRMLQSMRVLEEYHESVDMMESMSERNMKRVLEE